MTLVTGATGFIGAHVARTLLDRGDPVRALVRPTSDRRNIESLDIEIATGDLRDPPSLTAAVSGCETVYHVAADYRLWSRRPSDLFASNAQGTRNLLEACQAANVERIIYTSTVGTFFEPSGAYKRSKHEAEQIAIEYANQGLPVTIVNPTAPVGELDVKPTPTGRIIVDFLAGRMPAYLDTGLNLVDVRDVARGHLLAAEHGRPGERYLLGARNMSLREILETLARLSGRPAPKLRVPYAAAFAFSALETSWASLTGREPRAPLDAVRMARKKMYVEPGRAESDLGYQPGPIEPALERAIEWFRANQYC